MYKGVAKNGVPYLEGQMQVPRTVSHPPPLGRGVSWAVRSLSGRVSERVAAPLM